MNPELIKVLLDVGLGAMSFALFLRLGKVVANHEIRITVLERDKILAKITKRPKKKTSL